MTSAMLKRLRASKAVDLVEPVPNRWLSAADPMVNRQWGLRAIRWFDGKHPDAAKLHVAVLDSGIDDGHPDLKKSIEEYHHDGNAARDFLGHGTHVAGTIAAFINNSKGIAGVANCRLHCWKIFDDPKAGSTDQNFNFEFYSRALASALDLGNQGHQPQHWRHRAFPGRSCRVRGIGGRGCRGSGWDGK